MLGGSFTLNVTDAEGVSRVTGESSLAPPHLASCSRAVPWDIKLAVLPFSDTYYKSRIDSCRLHFAGSFCTLFSIPTLYFADIVIQAHITGRCSCRSHFLTAPPLTENLISHFPLYQTPAPRPPPVPISAFATR